MSPRHVTGIAPIGYLLGTKKRPRRAEARTVVEEDMIGIKGRDAMHVVLYDDFEFDHDLKPELRPAWKIVFADHLKPQEEA